jgi:glycosyltransferase-like protein
METKLTTESWIDSYSRNLRIALFVYSTQPRGGVVHTLELGTALHKLGNQVSIYALDKDGQGFGRDFPGQIHLVPTQPVNGGIDTLIRQRIQEFIDYLSGQNLRSHPYDCYHAQDCISANALAILRSCQSIPHFMRTVHHIEDFNSPYLQICQERSLLEPDMCLCVSKYWQEQLQNNYQISAHRVANGINLDRFSAIPNGTEASLIKALQLTGKPLYLTVGGIEPRKNSITLLKAFAQILAKIPTAQLIIAGGATLFDYHPYRVEFFAVADQLNIVVGKSLILPGVLPDDQLASLYRTADAFLFPSTTEGWGLVILEAIASGLPVVTSNRPPFTEFLSSGQAYLVDPESSTEIAAAAIAVVQPEISKTLVDRSQSLCTQYSWEQTARMHTKHYLQMSKGNLYAGNAL